MLRKNLLCIALTASAIIFSGSTLAKNVRISDGEVKQKIIEASIASYPGVCACPFNSARNGSSCGRRSAWSKEGGYAPICYAKEVSKEMVKQWRDEHSENS